jgi:GT2 family glycosyltransferase
VTRPAADSALAPPAKVCIVVLNWNGWRDTIECAESLFCLTGLEFVVVICDNASSDGSMEQIEAWARGTRPAPSASFLGSATPPVSKPLRFARYTRAEAEAGPPDDAPLVLIDTGANLGFAGGCNVGMRYALTRPDCTHVWLINSDCVVAPRALAEMVALTQRRPRVGICGSQVRYYDAPDIVQTFGGLLDRRFCTTHSLASGCPADRLTTEPAHLDYIPGASMLVTRALLEEVGLMAEDYFLYFEEIDWAERLKQRFDLAVCLDSIVYHRGAASIGSPSERGERGARSDYFLLRGRILFARKFYPRRLGTVYAGLLVSALNRLRRGQWTRARIALCALVGIRPAVLRCLSAPAKSQA